MQLKCRERVFSPEDGMGACSHDTSSTASGIFIPISTQGAGLDALEEQHCNGSLKKQPMSAGDDCDGQRYSADPTVFFGERNQKTTGEDGYMNPMNKSASGKIIIIIKKQLFEIFYVLFEELHSKSTWRKNMRGHVNVASGYT